MELAFAGLHQLCAPLLDGLMRLPDPQRDALDTALGLGAGAAPDRFLVGLALLGLLSEASADRPLVCLIDDAQWLDRASAQVLAFAARRLLAEPVAVVFVVREPSNERELVGLPELVVRGLRDADARALLDSLTPGGLDPRVRDRIVAETDGNPLALLELPLASTPGELAGGFGRPDATPLAGRIEQSFLRRLRSLPVPTQRLLLLAAGRTVGRRVHEARHQLPSAAPEPHGAARATDGLSVSRGIRPPTGNPAPGTSTDASASPQEDAVT